jgi:hypothetical protein
MKEKEKLEESKEEKPYNFYSVLNFCKFHLYSVEPFVPPVKSTILLSGEIVYEHAVT